MSEHDRDDHWHPGVVPQHYLHPKRRIRPPTGDFPTEPWRMVEGRFTPKYLPQIETLFCTSNGYLGIRGSHEEGAPRISPGTFLNGFYETWPIVHAEDAYGFAKTGQTILNVPDGSLIKLYVDDEAFDLSHVELDEYERALDMRRGTLDREVVWETPDGRHVRVSSRRMASLEYRHLAAILYEVTVLDASASLTLASQLHAPTNDVGHNGDPRLGKGFAENPLKPLDHFAGDGRVLLSFETGSSGLAMACGMAHQLESDCSHSAEFDVEPGSGRAVFHVDAEPGRTVRLVKYLAYHHAERKEEPELRFRIGRTLDRASRDGIESILDHQERRVADWWERADVEIDGVPDIQQEVRFNLFQILQASARVEGYGIPAKGLTGKGYEGHYFWDTEVYVLPLLNYAAPHVAKNVLRHRFEMLDNARERARELNQKGALFPWRTINGEEASAYYAAGTAQYHINADIAYAIEKYAHISGDLDALLHGGAEVLFETARLWADLGFYSERKDGRFCIHSVTGPDEYSAVVDNNAFTNLMARENLRAAARMVEILEGRFPDELEHLKAKLQPEPAEVQGWAKAAEAMYIPYDEKQGVHLQDDGFLDREVWDFDNTPPENYPLLLHYHPLVIYRHQVIKQADVVLATFLLGDAFTAEEKKRIFDYYDPLTTGDSSLSVCIQSIMASEIGYRKEACAYFNDAVAMDLGDIGGNVKDGCHIASMGGTWMALVHGFAGLRDPYGELRLRPTLPDGWERMRFRLGKREQLVEVDIREHETTYRIVHGTQLELQHCEERLVVRVDEPVTRPNRADCLD